MGYDNSERDLSDVERQRYIDEGREPALRLRVPDQDISFTDLVRGEITFPKGSFPDFVLVRPGGQPLYTLVNPVDDALMGITHVLRGEDLLSSTPRQITLYNALYDVGVAKFIPQFGHLPFVMGEGNKKLSKRNPESNLFLHRDRGFIPEGLLNYLALLGWSIAADRDIFSLEELKANFDVSSVNPNPARFDQKKADAINSAHIRMLGDEDFANRVLPYLKSEGLISDQPTERELQIIRAAAPLLKERMIVLSESVGMLGFLLSEKAELEFETEALASLDATANDVVKAAHQVLESVANFVAEDIQSALNLELVEKMELKPRVAFGPVRVAVSGRRVTPPLFESMEIMGKELTLARLEAFLQAH